MCQTASTGSAVPFRGQAYVETIVHTCADGGRALVSVVLFGSAAIGGWVETASDVDLILVVPDWATDEATDRLRSEVERIEILHRLRSHSAHGQPALEKLLDRVTAHGQSFFVCTRGDLLSGNIGRILRLHPGMTKYAMDVLKSSVHSCFFCYELRRASLEEEIGFFEQRLGSNRTLNQLLALRREYRNSFPFVVCCIPTLVRLHLRTSIDNRFPRKPTERPDSISLVTATGIEAALNQHTRSHSRCLALGFAHGSALPLRGSAYADACRRHNNTVRYPEIRTPASALCVSIRMHVEEGRARNCRVD